MAAGHPFRISMDLPIPQTLIEIAESVRGPIVGGSVPLYMIDEILHSPVVMVPIANHDNNQDSSNENLRIQNLWDGIELLAPYWLAKHRLVIISSSSP